MHQVAPSSYLKNRGEGNEKKSDRKVKSFPIKRPLQHFFAFLCFNEARRILLQLSIVKYFQRDRNDLGRRNSANERRRVTETSVSLNTFAAVGRFCK